MHESEKWKGSCSVVSGSSRPQGLQPNRLVRPWKLSGKSTGVGCRCLLHLTLWLILKGYKILAFASDRHQSAVLAMNSCSSVLHSPITLNSFTVPVSMLACSIAYAFLQETRKQGTLGSADLENRFIGVHLPRWFLVNDVPLLLAYYPLQPTTFWVRPPVLPICVAFCDKLQKEVELMIKILEVELARVHGAKDFTVDELDANLKKILEI